jgi:dihydrofolate reductase
VRKIVAGGLLSLDGVAEDPNRFFTEWDDVVDASIPRMIATQDAVILGRRTYDEWVGFWPGSEIEPFATFINGSQSTSRPPRRWSRSGRTRT